MKLNSLVFAIFLAFCVKNCMTQNVPSVSCQYSMSGTRYRCDITIFNPSGLNNFTIIDGVHLAGKNDSDVEEVNGNYRVNSINVPKIICDTFENVKYLDIYHNNIQYIDRIGINSCNKLTRFRVYNGSVTKIEENAFENLVNLDDLTLSFNFIEELPANIFKPLINLQYLFLYSNRLQVIHSNAFGNHSKLHTISIPLNRLIAISPAVVDNTVVTSFLSSQNNCIDIDLWNSNKTIISQALQKCFENYRQLGETTTTLASTSPSKPTTTSSPGNCQIGNLVQRVCDLEEVTDNLEDSKGEMAQSFEDLARRIDYLETVLFKVVEEKDELTMIVKDQEAKIQILMSERLMKIKDD